MRTAIITISTSLSAGRGEDESGPALAQWARDIGAEVVATEIVGDEFTWIESALLHYADNARCELVLTTGGTGFAPSDVTPEATRAVLEREAPGIAEAMRAASRPHTRNWMLSRAVAGIRGRTLIVNFPGSPQSIREVGDEIGGAIPHAVALLSQQPAGHDHGR